MKKVFSFLLLTMITSILIMCFTSCNFLFTNDDTELEDDSTLDDSQDEDLESDNGSPSTPGLDEGSGGLDDDNTNKHTHTPSDWIIDKEATCAVSGSKHKECTSCGETIETKNISTLSTHSPSDWIVDKKATCVETGERHKICTVCNDTLESETIEKLTTHTTGIVVKENVTNSTCIKKGSFDEVVYCSVTGCNAEISRTEKELDYSDHTKGNFVIENIVSASCTAEGSQDKVYYCTICSEEISRTTEKTPITHNFVNNTCQNCGVLAPSEGLAFEFNSSTKTYTLVGMGTCTDTYLIIPTVYRNYPVTDISQNFNGKSSIIGIVIPETITEIKYATFEGYYKLKYVTLSEGLTKIGSRAFYDCRHLTSITIPSTVQEIGTNAFAGCHKLIEVINKSDLPFTLKSSTYGSVAANALEIHTGESKIENVNGFIFFTYNNSTYLLDYVGDEVNLILPENHNGEKYEIYKTAFYQNDKIETLEIGSGVTKIGDWAFYECTSLKELKLGANLDSIGISSFEGCYRIIYITIPNNVITIGASAFRNCANLLEVHVGSSVQSIGSGAFEKCRKMINVSFETTYNRFEGSDLLTYAKTYGVDKDVPNYKTDSNGFLFYNGELLGYVGEKTNITLPSNYNGQSYKIAAYAFYESEIESINIGNGVTEIGDLAFYCSDITEINLGNTVQKIGIQAFYGCKLSSLTIPASVTYIGKNIISSYVNSVTFADKEGWYVSTNFNAAGGSSISSADIAKNAAYLLKQTYKDYYWHKS